MMFCSAFQQASAAYIVSRKIQQALKDKFTQKLRSLSTYAHGDGKSCKDS